MSRRSTDESLRKPRTLSGTPMNKFVNLISLGIFTLGGISWYLFELWPQSQKFMKNYKEGKFDDSPETKYRLESMKYLINDPNYFNLIVKLQERAYEKEKGIREKPWYVKYFTARSEEED